MNTTRRDFLSISTRIAGCTAAGMGLSSCGIGGLLFNSRDIPVRAGEATIDLRSEPSLQRVGGAVKGRFETVNGGGVVIIVRTGPEEFRAYAAQCTHWGAEVDMPDRNGAMVCPFHGSHFSSTDGSVLEGPAERMLLSFRVSFDGPGQRITIAGPDAPTAQ